MNNSWEIKYRVQKNISSKERVMLNVFQYLSTYTYLRFTIENIRYWWIEYAYLGKLNYALNINIFLVFCMFGKNKV